MFPILFGGNVNEIVSFVSELSEPSCRHVIDSKTTPCAPLSYDPTIP